MNKKSYYYEFNKLLIMQVNKYKLSLDTRGKKPVYSYNKYIKIFLEKLETGFNLEKIRKYL